MICAACPTSVPVGLRGAGASGVKFVVPSRGPGAVEVPAELPLRVGNRALSAKSQPPSNSAAPNRTAVKRFLIIYMSNPVANAQSTLAIRPQDEPATALEFPCYPTENLICWGGVSQATFPPPLLLCQPGSVVPPRFAWLAAVLPFARAFVSFRPLLGARSSTG